MKCIHFLRSPVFEDEQHTRVASALHGILLILGIALLLILPVLVFARYYAAFKGVCMGLMVLVITGMLNRRGHVEIASLFLMIATLAILDYLLWTGEGIHDVAILGFAFILISGGMLLGRKHFLFLSALVVASANFIIFADLQGWYDSGFVRFTNYYEIPIASTLLITTALVVRMLADNLLTSLEKTRQVTETQAALLHETRSQAEQLRTLNRVSIAVASGLDLENVLVELYQQLQKIVPVDSFYVSLIDHRLGLVTFPIFYSADERIYIPREKLDLGSGLTGEVIRTGKTLYLPDLAVHEVQELYEIILVGEGESRSYVGVPLQLHGEVIGVLSVQGQDPNAYAPDQVQMLETIASQVSVAIDNARLFEEITDALKREERLNEVARVISGTLDKQFILENVMRLAVELLAADCGSLSLVAPDGEALSEVHNFNLPEAVNGGYAPKGRGLTWWVIENSRSITLKDYSQDPRSRMELRNTGLHGAAFAPILAGDERLGALGVLSFDPLKVFLERDVGLLEAVGRLAGAAIQNARLFSALQQGLMEHKLAEAALHQRDAILEAVAYAAETFMKTTDWQNVIQDVLAHLGAEIGANHAYIFQAERDGSGEPLLSMQYEWVAQGDAPDIGNPRFEKAPAQAIGPAAWFSAMQRGEPYYGSRSTLPPDEIQFMDKYSIQSYLDMPIQVGQEFWGIIGFENSLEEKDWGEAEIDSLKVAASVLGAAIQRQQTDLAIRLLNFELEQRVQERTAELESANRELESFAYSVSHDLRTPLRGIDGYSKLLRDDYASLLDQQGREYLENVIRATTRMADLINDLLKLSRVTRTEMHRVVVNLSDMAEELLEEMRQREPQRRVEVHVQEGLQAYGDPNLLRLALNNLLGNAWKFTSHTASARIEVGAQQNNGRTTYYVSDNGVGFDMKFKDKLFVAFQRLHSASEFEGTGVGLATVQRVITRHSGQIWAEGRLRQGAAFYFTLPGPGMGD